MGKMGMTEMGYGQKADGAKVPLGTVGVEVAQAGPGFVVTGSGRSGTTYISTLLRKVGINCGHEEWFTPFVHQRKTGLDGDASWMAVPVLQFYQGKVLVQGRHPLSVVRSLAGYDHGAFMRGDVPQAVFWQMKCQALPLLGLRRDAVYNSAVWWIAIYEKALAHADMVWTVEGMNGLRLASITNAVGRPVNMADCESAVETTPTNIHAHHQGVADIAWGDLPKSLKPRMWAVMEQLGYTSELV